ncbi:MAG: branched-chain amino acid ABC transporter permease [Pseudomonadota bacterium]|nr:branched-chain amino acid ABC transporter permease [Pseudomonadota bacterium]
MSLLSGDPPRGLPARVLVGLIALALAAAPFAFPGAKPLGVAEKICVMAALAASYDLLLGYTGIVSFAHVMFYGVGAYGVGLALYALGPGWGALALGLGAGLALAAALALVLGLFSLRVQAIFFAMVTLAVAYAFNVLASQLPNLTGGEDGRSFNVPAMLRPGYKLGEFLGLDVTGRTLTYYLVFAGAAALFLLLLRVVNSPFGRVCQAIRENPLRAEALGYRIVVHRTLATLVAALAAACAGALNALWLRYVGPDTALSFSIQIDVLVIVVIGGRGTLYGAVVGAAVFVIAENYLRALIGAASSATAGLPLLPGLLHPDRWLLWLGVLFILAVRFAPRGIIGELARRSTD